MPIVLKVYDFSAVGSWPDNKCEPTFISNKNPIGLKTNFTETITRREWYYKINHMQRHRRLLPSYYVGELHRSVNISGPTCVCSSFYCQRQLDCMDDPAIWGSGAEYLSNADDSD